jgi:hypothetical protein
MPALAIFQHEWRGLWSSWLVRLWLIASVLQTLLTLPEKWGRMQTAPLLSSLMFPYLVFPWFIIVVFLGITPVTGARLEALSDGILSRPIARYEYFIACWVARVAVVLSVFSLVLVPFTLLITFAQRPAPTDTVTWFGVISAFVVVALVLTFLVSLGFVAGALARRPLVAALLLIFGWYPLTLALHVYSMEEFSLLSLNQAMPTVLRTKWSDSEADKRRLSNVDIQAMGKYLSLLSGGAEPQNNGKSDFFETFFSKGDYRDFSLVRVIFGYGVPTLLALGLATLVFCRRDL